jgi:hypothetical protein
MTSSTRKTGQKSKTGQNLQNGAFATKRGDFVNPVGETSYNRQSQERIMGFPNFHFFHNFSVVYSKTIFWLLIDN